MTTSPGSSTPECPLEFRRRREALQLTIRQFSNAMDISPALISLMQNGKRPIRRAYWLALAQLELLARQDLDSSGSENGADASASQSLRSSGE
jgi:hypothetical protein